ncbi:hypothetical protein SteCoe_9420 [Stentor coeruleus]|uniref:RING-type domain-containing protein n=1 Tax=Stentor coeruleus TaxID=5963 RepID=A0A1R2CI53_9CILI|nr:hypothetical protein SteCoe_9420 [Stentor coeruleus]
MITISPMFEIQEERVEDDGNSTINITHDRLTTEYLDEEDIGSAKEIEKMIETIIQYISATFLCFITLQIIVLLSLKYILMIIPIVLLELKYTVLILARLKMNKLSFNRKTLKKLTMPLGKLICYVLLISSAYIPSLAQFLAALPIFLTSLFDLFLRLPWETRFEKIYHLTLSYFRLLAGLSLLFISLKQENHLSISMDFAMWPIWILISTTLLLTIVSLMILTISLFSYYHKTISLGDALCSLWIFFLLSGCTITSLLFIYDLLNNKLSYICIGPLIYLFLLLVFTFAIKNYICILLKCYLPNHRIDLSNISSTNTPLPLPASQAFHMNSLKSKKNIINLPPKALMRISSSYYQPSSIELKKKTGPVVSRAFSLDLKDLSKTGGNKRSLSLAEKPEDEFNDAAITDDAVTEKKCVICVEGPCDSVLMDCGHGGICFTCASLMVKQKESCHFCRAPIIRALKIKVKKANVIDVVGTSC